MIRTVLVRPLPREEVDVLEPDPVKAGGKRAVGDAPAATSGVSGSVGRSDQGLVVRGCRRRTLVGESLRRSGIELVVVQHGVEIRPRGDADGGRDRERPRGAGDVRRRAVFNISRPATSEEWEESGISRALSRTEGGESGAPDDRGGLAVAAGSEGVVADGAAPASVGLASARTVVRRIVEIESAGVACSHQVCVDWGGWGRR